MPKYCSECGLGNPDTAKFCQQCGAPLEVGVSQEEPESQTRSEQRPIGMQGRPQKSQGMPGGMAGPDDNGERPHLRLRVADMGPRVLAYIIDVIILEIVLYVIGYQLFQVNWIQGTETQMANALNAYQTSGDTTALMALVNLNQFYFEFVVNWLVYYAYFGILESVKGKTLGKAILSLRSVKERDGQPIGPKEGFVNSIGKSFGFHFLFIPLIIDVILGAATQKNRTLRQIRLGQRLSGEVVIKVTR